MNKLKPNLIKILGFGIMGFSGLVIIINSLGLLMNIFLMNIDQHAHNDPFFSYAIPLASVVILFGITMFIAGLFMYKQKNWARILMQIVCILGFLGMLSFSYFMGEYIPTQEQFFQTFQYVVIGFWSLPFLLLFFFLRTKKVRKHF